jgi:hypothetical protein
MRSTSAPTRLATSAERLSLSPNLSSSTATVSFSLTIGRMRPLMEARQSMLGVQIAAAVGEVSGVEQHLRDGPPRFSKARWYSAMSRIWPTAAVA